MLEVSVGLVSFERVVGGLHVLVWMIGGFMFVLFGLNVTVAVSQRYGCSITLGEYSIIKYVSCGTHWNDGGGWGNLQIVYTYRHDRSTTLHSFWDRIIPVLLGTDSCAEPRTDSHSETRWVNCQNDFDCNVSWRIGYRWNPECKTWYQNMRNAFSIDERNV